MHVLEAIDGDCGLRVTFARRSDRFAHLVEVRDGQHWRVLLESLEGDDQQAWPPSPPLQEVTIERRGPAARVALGVGMAGMSHWSISVELQPDAMQLAFDVACRCQQAPPWLGSKYLTSADVEPIAARTGGLRFELQHWTCALSVLADDALLQRPTPQSIAIQPPLIAAGTVRWRYAIGRA